MILIYRTSTGTAIEVAYFDFARISSKTGISTVTKVFRNNLAPTTMFTNPTTFYFSSLAFTFAAI
jgi:hypothetical protein